MATETPNLPEQLHKRPGNEVAVQAGVPYAVDNDESLTSLDILIPRMKLVQKMSRVLDDELVEYGAVYALTSQDDMEPVTLAKAPAKGDLGDPVRFYVLGDPVKGWSWTDPDNKLQRGSEYPNLAWVINQNPRKVNRTYRYLLTVPSYPMLPVSFLMYGAWGGQSAKFINTQLVLFRQKGVDPSTIAFKLQARKTSRPSQGSEQPYIQAIVGFDKVTAKDKAADLEIVAAQRELMQSSTVAVDDDREVATDTTATNAPDLG